MQTYSARVSITTLTDRLSQLCSHPAPLRNMFLSLKRGVTWSRIASHTDKNSRIPLDSTTATRQHSIGCPRQTPVDTPLSTKALKLLVAIEPHWMPLPRLDEVAVSFQHSLAVLGPLLRPDPTESREKIEASSMVRSNRRDTAIQRKSLVHAELPWRPHVGSVTYRYRYR
jgi:hypothetical protein